MSYARRVSADIERWKAAGLVGPDTAIALLRDVEATAGHSRFSLGRVVAMLAGLLFVAAILIVVASNWEAIPRLMRVGALFALILGGFLGGALLAERGMTLFRDALYLVGAGAFGGSLAAIGQMYHLSGDEAAAMLTWCGATALAAAALRSRVLTVAAVLVGFAWFTMQLGFLFSTHPFPFFYLLLVLPLWLLALWTGSRPARHLILLSLIAYAIALTISGNVDMWPAGILTAVSAVLFAVAALRPHLAFKATRLGAGLMADALLGFWAGTAMLQAEFNDTGLAIPLGALALGGFVGALALGGQSSRFLRWIAYAGFAAETCFLYVATVGTMLGTAGLFLAAALALAGLAFIIVRLERRLGGGRPLAGVPA